MNFQPGFLIHYVDLAHDKSEISHIPRIKHFRGTLGEYFMMLLAGGVFQTI